MDFAYRVSKEARVRVLGNLEEQNISESPENVSDMIPDILRYIHEQWKKEGSENQEEKEFFDKLPKFIKFLEEDQDPNKIFEDPDIHHVVQKVLNGAQIEQAPIYKQAFDLGSIVSNPLVDAGALGLGMGALALVPGAGEAADVALAPEEVALLGETGLAGDVGALSGDVDAAAKEGEQAIQDIAKPVEGEVGAVAKDAENSSWFKKALKWAGEGVAGSAILHAIKGGLGGGSGGGQSSGGGGGMGLTYDPVAAGVISGGNMFDPMRTIGKVYYSEHIPDNLIEEERNTMHRASVEDDAGILVYAAKDLRMEQLREQVRASLEAWANSSNDPQNPESLPQAAFAVWWALYNAATKADDIATLSGILAAVPEMYHTQGVPQVEVPNASGGSDTQTGLAAAPNPMEMNDAKEAQPLAFNPGGSQPEQPGQSPGNLIPGALSSVQRVGAWKIADMSGMQANMPAPGIPAGAAPPVPSVPPTTAETTGAMGDQTNQTTTHQMNYLPANPVNSTQVQAPDPNVQQAPTGPTGQMLKGTSPAGSNIGGFARAMTSNAKESNWQIVADVAPPPMLPGMMGMMSPQQILPQQPSQSTEEMSNAQSTNQGFAGSELKQNQPAQMTQTQHQQPFSTAQQAHPILTSDGQFEGTNPQGTRISSDTSVIPNKEQPDEMSENIDQEKTTDPHEITKIKDKEGKVIEVGAVYELSNEDYSPELVRVASIRENGVVVQTLDTSMQFFVTSNEKPQFIQKKASMLSSREQDSLINETGTARNLSDVRLSDSHYEDEYPKFHEKLIEAFDHSRPLSNASLFDDDSLFL